MNITISTPNILTIACLPACLCLSPTPHQPTRMVPGDANQKSHQSWSGIIYFLNCLLCGNTSLLWAYCVTLACFAKRLIGGIATLPFASMCLWCPRLHLHSEDRRWETSCSRRRSLSAALLCAAVSDFTCSPVSSCVLFVQFITSWLQRALAEIRQAV